MPEFGQTLLRPYAHQLSSIWGNLVNSAVQQLSKWKLENNKNGEIKLPNADPNWKAGLARLGPLKHHPYCVVPSTMKYGVPDTSFLDWTKACIVP